MFRVRRRDAVGKVDATNRGGRGMYYHLCSDDKIMNAYAPQDLRSHGHFKGPFNSLDWLEEPCH